MALRPSTRTFGQVKKTVRRIFGDESGVQLEDGDIVQWANDAQTNIIERNQALKAVSTQDSSVGVATYDFPTPKIAQVEAITYDGVLVTNVEMATALAVIQSGDPQQTQQGTPLSWYEWAGKFTFYPVPDAVKTITVYYTRYPAEFTGADDQLLDLPDKYFQPIVDFCLWKAFEMDEDWKAAQVKEGHFRQAIEEQSEEEREAQHMTYPVIQEVTW